MLKIHSSFSKKVPVDGIRMSSQSYHATVEMELPDGLTAEQLQQKIHETFELVRGSVEKELSSPAEPKANGSARSNGKAVAPASEKQILFLRDIAAKQGVTPRELDDEARSLFGTRSIRQLTKVQASRLIDNFNQQSTRRKAA